MPKSSITFEISFDDSDARWSVGVLSKWNERIEICRSHECGPFTTETDVRMWLNGLWRAWVAPALGAEASESLHDAYAELAP